MFEEIIRFFKNQVYTNVYPIKLTLPDPPQRPSYNPGFSAESPSCFKNPYLGSVTKFLANGMSVS